MSEWNEQDQPASVLPQHPKTQETQDITNDICPGTDESVTEITEGKNDEAEAKKPFSLSTLILEYLELFVICLGVVLIIFSMMFRICTVSGGSMLPTLKDGELLLVSNLLYEPKSGDIIIFHQTSQEIERFNEPIVKRVIATEGQNVYIDFTLGTVAVDGVELGEDYIQLVNSLNYNTGEYTLFAEHHFQMVPYSDGTTHRVFEATVPEGCLFVMGDNRNNSADSRTKVIGFVDERRVLGRVLFRMGSEIGLVPVN